MPNEGFIQTHPNVLDKISSQSRAAKICDILDSTLITYFVTMRPWFQQINLELWNT